MSHLIVWESVCLVCLQKCENRSIFEQDNDSNLIADKIMKCADILIKKSTNHPENICLQCLEALNIAYKFRQNCEQSDSIIKALLNANHKKFEIKNLWKTTSITMNPDACIKDEIVDKPEVDDVCDEESTPCLGMEDDPDTESTFVENHTDASVHSSDEKLNNVKTTESNETKKETNNEISRQPKKSSPNSTYKGPPENCKICDLSFKRQHALDIHMRRHNNERPFNCDHCDKSFVSVSELQRHVRGYTGQRSYKCQYCDRGFLDSHARKNHERTHTDERPYVCPTCGKSFTYACALTEHLRIHTGLKKFMCKECGKGFGRKVPFEKHAADHLTQDEMNKSSELEQNKREKKEIFRVEEFANSNEINSKHENVDKAVIDDIPDDTNSPCPDLKDVRVTESKLVVEDRADACEHGSDIELHEKNKPKQGANNDISRRPIGRQKKLTKVSSPKIAYKGSLKNCEMCNLSFKRQSAFDVHMRRHNNERPFTCDHCDKSFVTVSELQRHVRGYTGQRPYKCQYCDRGFVDSHARANHERLHTGERPYVCPTCGKSFTYSTSLSDHIRIHTGLKKFVCTICGKGFARNVLLKRHAVRHQAREELNKSSKNKQKKLQKIEKSHKSSIKHEIIFSAVVDDTRDVHNASHPDLEGVPDTETKFVENCADAYVHGTDDKLNNVKVNENNEDKQEANNDVSKRPKGRPRKSAKVSGKKPSSKSTYKGPLKNCEICNLSFKRQSALDIHMRRHNNERPFTCDHCDKSFVSLSELQRHVRGYTGQRPYKCQHCDRGFQDSHARKNHERLHTGERPYVCPTCGKSFTYSTSLSDHIRIHTGLKKFVCTKCGKGFARKTKLEAHATRHLTRDELDKQKKRQEQEVFQIVQTDNPNEINIKHEIIDNALMDDPVTEAKLVFQIGHRPVPRVTLRN